MTKIAVISDSHDHVQTLELVLKLANEAGAQALLHCGDLCAPFMLNLMAERFSGPIHVVFGNNDGDGRLLQTIAGKHAHVTLHGIYCELGIGGRQIAMIHYPEPARRIAQSGAFDLVCYGHDHLKYLEQIGQAWLLNPGELMGFKAAPTWALYDAGLGTATIREASQQ
jgi:putative phosphoesterase